MFTLLSISNALVALYLSYLVCRLINDTFAARWTGLPILVCPMDPGNPIWLLLSVPLRPWLKRNLPAPIWNRLTLTIYGWEFYEKRRPFDEYAAPQGDSKSFFVASCGGLELFTAHPTIVFEVLQHVGNFEMPALTGLFLGQFGYNVLTSNATSG